jgi:hypothetical protein
VKNKPLRKLGLIRGALLLPTASNVGADFSHGGRVVVRAAAAMFLR